MAVYLVPVVIIETVEKTAICRVEADNAVEAAALALDHEVIETSFEKVIECIEWKIVEVWADKIKEEGAGNK